MKQILMFFWGCSNPRGRVKGVGKNTPNLHGGKKLVLFFKSPLRKTAIFQGAAPGHNPPASTPPAWAPAAPLLLNPLLACTARPPPSPSSPGSLLAAGTCPAPGPRSAAPARLAPSHPGGRRRECWTSGWLCAPGGSPGEGAKRGESGSGGETTEWVSLRSSSGWLPPSPVSRSPFSFCASWWKQSKNVQRRQRC